MNITEMITLHWEIKEKFDPLYVIERMQNRELVIVVEVLDGVATPHSCYKDSDGRLYVKKYVEMEAVDTELKDIKQW